MEPMKIADKVKLLAKIETETITNRDGTMYWIANGAPVPLDCFEKAGLRPPPKQAKALDDDFQNFITEVVKPTHPLSEEESYELRASFNSIFREVTL